jgi:hypothetical protein
MDLNEEQQLYASSSICERCESVPNVNSASNEQPSKHTFPIILTAAGRHKDHKDEYPRNDPDPIKFKHDGSR